MKLYFVVIPPHDLFHFLLSRVAPANFQFGSPENVLDQAIVLDHEHKFAWHLLIAGHHLGIGDRIDASSREPVADDSRVATGMIAGIESPLDLLSQPRKRPRKNSKDQPSA